MNDFNSAQENRHPRLLMQFDKQEKVPKLVSINQADSHGYQNYQTKNSQTQRQFYVRNRQQKIDKDPRLQAIRLQRELQMEKLQKIELQSIIKELTIKSQRLKQINQHLILRLKEVQKNYIQNRSELQKENQQECRKLKNNIYLDVQTYVKTNIETLKISLQGEKMNPKVQQKIQNFMEEMLQINSHSVEMLKISRRKQPPNHLHFLTESNLKKGERTSVEKLNIANLSLQSTEKKSLGPQKSEYQTLLKHLSRQKSKKELTNSFYQSSYNNNFRTNQKDRSRYWNQHQYQNRNHSNSRSMFRNQYSTTPHKRKKIFQKFYRS